MALQSPARPSRDVATAVARRRSRSANQRRRRRQVALWLVVAVIVGIGSFGAGLLAAPLDYSFQPTPPQAVLLQDSTGRTFATIRAPQEQEPVPSAQIPAVVKKAVVAAEDERFFAHSGVDPLAMVRALWRDVSGAQLQGGSTITQQYVKNVYTGSQRTALRKLREASLAIRLEQHLTKDQILTRYLNTLYLGNGTAGVQAASKYYFGVPVQQIDLDRSTGEHDPTLALRRAATLAGFVPAPSAWNPVKDPDQSRRRELYVLNQMVKNRMISPQQASAAYGDGLPKIVARSQPEAPTVAPEFRDYVDNQLEHTLALHDTQLFGSGGVKVRTTLDLDLQKAAVHALASVLSSKDDPDAAVVAVDPRNGDIRALTTKRKRGYTRLGFDLATNASRSSGSTIKPFTLAYALMHGHSLDEPHAAPGCVTVPFHLCNAEQGSSYQTLRTALIHSINTVYGPLAVDLGLGKVLKFARAAGLDIGALARDSRGHLYPAQSIGVPVTPLSEAVGFGTIVNHGVHHGPRSIMRVHSSVDGELYSAPAHPDGDRVMPRGVADAVTSVMQGVVDSGTGTAARQPFPVFGKTGTTDDETNAWFTGCTRTLCIAVWMGYEKQYFNNGKTPHSMKNIHGVGEVFGGTLPARIFAQTWSDYRILQQPHGSLSPTPTPTPQPTFSSSGQTTRPSSGAPKPSESAKPSPTPSASEPAVPTPTPSPSRTLLPPPTSPPASPAQDARRVRLAT